MSNSTENLKPIRCEVCHRLLGYIDGDALIKCERCKSDNYVYDNRIDCSVMHLDVASIRRRLPTRMKNISIKGEEVNYSTTRVDMLVGASV